MTQAFAILLVFGLPFVLLRYEKRVKLIAILSPVLLCYAIGLSMGTFFGALWDREFLEEMASIFIPLAIPLLLFNENPASWFRQGPKAILSFIFCALAVSIAISLLLMFGKPVDQAAAIGAMLVGVYTGGTPNMAAIGQALNVENEIFLALNLFDTLICGIYLLFLLSLGPRLLRWVFGLRRKSAPAEATEEEMADKVAKPRPVFLAFLLSGLILAIALGISFLVMQKIEPITVLISITVLSIGLSFSPRVNRLHGAYQSGEYLVLGFCVLIGLLSDFNDLVNTDTDLFVFTALVVVGAVSFHYLLAWLFGLDADLVMITSTAALFGPAFVGVMSSRLNNKKLLPIGMTIGVIGYASANFLGVATYVIFTQLLA